MIHKALHRKHIIEQHEAYNKTENELSTPEG